MFQDVFMVDVNKVVLYFIQESQSVVFPLLLQRLQTNMPDHSRHATRCFAPIVVTNVCGSSALELIKALILRLFPGMGPRLQLHT